MAEWQPDQPFRNALTKLDAGEADLIVTPEAEVAEWARVHGYQVARGGDVDGMAIYEIRPRDTGPVNP